MSDITVSRLHHIAQNACTSCAGPEHPMHQPAGYRVLGMRAYAKKRTDAAIAWFDLTRGSVVVRIDGQQSWVWWFRTWEQAETYYYQEHPVVFLSQET